jgi:hypothetical protein
MLFDANRHTSSFVHSVDEVGRNTSQAKDGTIGGKTFLCTKEGRPQNHASTKDVHFTIFVVFDPFAE